MRYIVKYQNPSKPIIKTGQFLPQSVLVKRPKQTSNYPDLEEKPDVKADLLADTGTRILSALKTFGGSAIGNVVKDIGGEDAAKAVEKYTLGMIPYTRQEEFEANRQQGNWKERGDKALEAGAWQLSGQGMGILMEKFGPVIAKKIVDMPANEAERVIAKLSNPKRLAKFEAQANIGTAKFHKTDIRGKYTQSKYTKQLQEAKEAKSVATNDFNKNVDKGTIDLKKYPKGELSPREQYLLPYKQKIESVENAYRQKIADKIGLPMKANEPLGGGAYGTVFPMKGKGNENMVVKIGRAADFETPETMYYMKQVGKELNDANIALPTQTTFFKGKYKLGISQIMPRVEGKPVKGMIDVPQKSMDELTKRIETLREKGIFVDFANPDNILYNPKSGNFSLVDLNTQAPKYHWFDWQNNNPKQGWRNVLEERYQWKPEVPVPERSPIASPMYSFGDRSAKLSLGPRSFKPWERPMNEWMNSDKTIKLK